MTNDSYGHLELRFPDGSTSKADLVIRSLKFDEASGEISLVGSVVGPIYTKKRKSE